MWGALEAAANGRYSHDVGSAAVGAVDGAVAGVRVVAEIVAVVVDGSMMRWREEIVFVRVLLLLLPLR